MKKVQTLILCLFTVFYANAQQQMFLTRSTEVVSIGIMDNYQGANVAFALDELIYSSYADSPPADDLPGSLTNGQTGAWTVTLRRSSDDAIKSFKYNEINASSLTDPGEFCASTTCYVYRLWNQAGSNHADQTNPSNQPILVDNGSLIIENGKPGILSGNYDNFFRTSTLINANTCFVIAKPNSTAIVGYVLGNSVNTNNGLGISSGFYNKPFFTVNGNTVTSGLNNTLQKIYYAATTGSEQQFGINNNQIVTRSTTDLFQFDTVCNRRGLGTDRMLGVIQFVLTYSSDQSSNQSGIIDILNNTYQTF